MEKAIFRVTRILSSLVALGLLMTPMWWLTILVLFVLWVVVPEPG